MQLPSLLISLFNVSWRVRVVNLARVLPFHKEISLSVNPSAFPSYLLLYFSFLGQFATHTYTAYQPLVFSAPLLPSPSILPLQYHRIKLPDLTASLHWLLKEVAGLPLIPVSWQGLP